MKEFKKKTKFMESDKIEKVYNSTIQHGNLSKRAYLMKLAEEDHLKIITFLDELCQKNKYTKIFAKVPETVVNLFKLSSYNQEAKIPGFFNGKGSAIFMAKYFSLDRQKNKQAGKMKNILKTAVEKSKTQASSKKKEFQYEIDILKPSDVEYASEIYKQVFNTYPFPIYDPQYLLDTMKKNIEYYCLCKDGQILAMSSAEMDLESKSVEMTDFATLPAWRGNNFSIKLLNFMEKEMIKKNIITAYTIARSLSYAMNITFAKNNYKYAGTLINNTNIAGSIESMNVWYKKFNEGKGDGSN